MLLEEERRKRVVARVNALGMAGAVTYLGENVSTLRGQRFRTELTGAEEAYRAFAADGIDRKSVV